jgi:adenylate kinase family enzyme
MRDASPTTTERWSGLLLLGPTGSGKTPLGDHLERTGFRGRRCVHFDFGASLREAASGGGAAAGLVEGELAVVRASLRGGALLEDEHLSLALKMLEGFAARRRVGREDLIVLNGFPRHAGQAAGLAPLAAVELVVVMEARPDVVRERIRLDAGGDRAGRGDDSAEEVRRKLATFAARTLPLAAFYRDAGVPVVRVAVDVATRPEDIIALLEAELAEGGAR